MYRKPDRQARRKLFFDSLAEKFNIGDLNDWRKIRTSDIVEAGGEGLLKKYKKSHHQPFSRYGNLKNALASVYPEYMYHTPENPKFQNITKYLKIPRKCRLSDRYSPSKAQRLLQNYLQRIFPKETVVINFIHPQLRYSQTKRHMELDICIHPDLRHDLRKENQR